MKKVKKKWDKEIVSSLSCLNKIINVSAALISSFRIACKVQGNMTTTVTITTLYFISNLSEIKLFDLFCTKTIHFLFVCFFFLPSFSRVSSQEESVANSLIVGFWKCAMSQIGYTCGFGQWSPIIKFTKNYHTGVKILMKLQLDFIENIHYIMLPLVFIFWGISISWVIRTVMFQVMHFFPRTKMRVIWVSSLCRLALLKSNPYYNHVRRR